MTILLQRICWNSLGWRGPTGELFGQEDSYVGKNGLGHEEWNFSTTDILQAKVFGYSYYNPSQDSPKLGKDHAIYFFAIQPDKQRVLVGYYKHARFLDPKQKLAIKSEFMRSSLLPKRVDELLALNLPAIGSAKEATQLLVDGFSANIVVEPENVFSLNPPIPLTPEMVGGRNPLHINRYTKPLFLDHAPSLSTRDAKVKRPSKPGSLPSLTKGTSASLPEEAYCRFSQANMKVIVRMHNQLSNRFREWLNAQDCHAIVAEQSGIDVSCKASGIPCLFELKTTARQSARLALRDAIGQLLEYNYYPGRTPREALAVVLDDTPSDDDVRWVKKLCNVGIPIELFWLKGTTVYSSSLTGHPLATCAVNHI